MFMVFIRLPLHISIFEASCWHFAAAGAVATAVRLVIVDGAAMAAFRGC